MKKVISYLLIFCMMLHCSARLGIIAYFYTNQSYIAEVLCINKEKPAIHCEGKCFLSQKLKSHDEKEKQAPRSLKVVEEVVYFIQDNTVQSNPTLEKSAVTIACFFALVFYQSPSPSIDIPPKL